VVFNGLPIAIINILPYVANSYQPAASASLTSLVSASAQWPQPLIGDLATTCAERSYVIAVALL
jgi:hypothetical protein